MHHCWLQPKSVIKATEARQLKEQGYENNPRKRLLTGTEGDKALPKKLSKEHSELKTPPQGRDCSGRSVPVFPPPFMPAVGPKPQHPTLAHAGGDHRGTEAQAEDPRAGLAPCALRSVAGLARVASERLERRPQAGATDLVIVWDRAASGAAAQLIPACQHLQEITAWRMLLKLRTVDLGLNQSIAGHTLKFAKTVDELIRVCLVIYIGLHCKIFDVTGTFEEPLRLIMDRPSAYCH